MIQTLRPLMEKPVGGTERLNIASKWYKVGLGML
jgi:hypothetical protein